MKISVDMSMATPLSGKQGGNKEGGPKGFGISDLSTTVPDNRARGVSPAPSDKGSNAS